MLYERKNSLEANLWKVETGIDFSFPPNLHSSFELITVTDGKMVVTVDKKQYTITPGQAVLVFPNQVHSLRNEGHCSHFLCIFSPKLVQAYGRIYQSYVPKNNLFSPGDDLLERIAELVVERPGELGLKGVLYSLCDRFDRESVYEERSVGADELMAKIFGFVESCYFGDCSLATLSAHTSYNYVYLSRYFKKITGLSFTEYVNRYRVNEATYLLGSGERAVLEVAMDCGFDSLRSFNRNFKKIMGVSPSEYRKKCKTK